MKKTFYQYGTCLYVFTGFALPLHSGVYVSGHFNNLAAVAFLPPPRSPAKSMREPRSPPLLSNWNNEATPPTRLPCKARAGRYRYTGKRIPWTRIFDTLEKIPYLRDHQDWTWKNIDKVSMFIYLNWKNYWCNLMVPNDKFGPIGKPVKFRYGPAAVIGDQRRNTSLSMLNSVGRRG